MRSDALPYGWPGQGKTVSDSDLEEKTDTEIPAIRDIRREGDYQVMASLP